MTEYVYHTQEQWVVTFSLATNMHPTCSLFSTQLPISTLFAYFCSILQPGWVHLS